MFCIQRCGGISLKYRSLSIGYFSLSSLSIIEPGIFKNEAMLITVESTATDDEYPIKLTTYY